MNKEEAAMIGFEVVACAGEARSKLMEALEEAEKKNFEQAERLVEEAHTSLMQAHKSQTQMLAAEANGESVEIGFIMVHAQDHLMTTMTLLEVAQEMNYLYQKNK